MMFTIIIVRILTMSTIYSRRDSTVETSMSGGRSGSISSGTGRRVSRSEFTPIPEDNNGIDNVNVPRRPSLYRSVRSVPGQLYFFGLMYFILFFISCLFLSFAFFIS